MERDGRPGVQMWTTTVKLKSQLTETVRVKLSRWESDTSDLRESKPLDGDAGRTGF